MKILVTGMAGFVGFHTAKKLLEEGFDVVGMDNINGFYDVNLKLDRLQALGLDTEQIKCAGSNQKCSAGRIAFYKFDLENNDAMMALFEAENIQTVCHLAAQPGIRYSLENPHLYVQSNIVGFLNVLEASRKYNIKHLIYASSSSVYGLNSRMPFSTSQGVDHPVSLYAATKKSNELMAHTYSHLYALPTTGLRFFTVYGPWGRPDMAPHLFVDSIFKNRPIKLFNNGQSLRDFTYVDDIVQGILSVIHRPPSGDATWSGFNPDPSSSTAPYKLYNIGSSTPVMLIDFIKTLEDIIGQDAIKEFLPMQPGDVVSTFADVSELTAQMGYTPDTDLITGLRSYVQWFREYYRVDDQKLAHLHSRK